MNNMFKNKMGYKDSSPFKNLPSIEIDSNNITMQGVSQPIMAFPNNDKPKLMLPGKNYNFPNSTKVLEKKIFQDGGTMNIKQGNKNVLNEFLSTLNDKQKKAFMIDWEKMSEEEKQMFLQTVSDNLSKESFMSGGMSKDKSMKYQSGGIAKIDDGTDRDEALNPELTGVNTVLSPNLKENPLMNKKAIVDKKYLELLESSNKPFTPKMTNTESFIYHKDGHVDHGIKLGADGKYYNADGTRALRSNNTPTTSTASTTGSNNTIKGLKGIKNQVTKKDKSVYTKEELDNIRNIINLKYNLYDDQQMENFNTDAYLDDDFLETIYNTMEEFNLSFEEFLNSWRSENIKGLKPLVLNMKNRYKEAGKFNEQFTEPIDNKLMQGYNKRNELMDIPSYLRRNNNKKLPDNFNFNFKK